MLSSSCPVLLRYSSDCTYLELKEEDTLEKEASSSDLSSPFKKDSTLSIIHELLRIRTDAIGLSRARRCSYLNKALIIRQTSE